MVNDTQFIDTFLLTKLRAEWAKTKSNAERVIIAGKVLTAFGPDVTAGDQEKGWPCEMLRSISRMMSVSA
jgi:hypothetical protein